MEMANINQKRGKLTSIQEIVVKEVCFAMSLLAVKQYLNKNEIKKYWLDHNQEEDDDVDTRFIKNHHYLLLHDDQQILYFP